jgi:hypothetical protein
MNESSSMPDTRLGQEGRSWEVKNLSFNNMWDAPVASQHQELKASKKKIGNWSCPAHLDLF